MFLRPFYFLVWCFAVAAERIEVWIFTRNPIWLVQGLPALFIVGACGTVVYSYGGRNRVDVLDRYNAAISQALQRSEYDTAELFLHKLLQIDESRADVRFRLALLAEQRQELGRAHDMMLQLAPDDSVGHAGAHFWRAQRYMASHPEVSADQTDPLIHHLTAALSHPASKLEAHALLGQLYFARQQFEQSVSHFLAVADTEPRWRVMVARCYLALGNRNQAVYQLSLLGEHLRTKLGDHDTAGTDARLLLAEASILQRDYDKAEQILEAGLLAPDAARCREALAEMYVQRFDAAGENASTIGQRAAWLEKALHHAPQHVGALVRLARFLKSDGSTGQVAKAAIQDALASGKAPAVLHLILGTNAAQDGDMNLARMHMEQAQRLEPNAPVVLNNLAWVLTKQEPPQYERALVLVNEAVLRAPANARIRETRGQILAKLNRWSEALADLEVVLGETPENADLHRTIAEVYDQLGNPEMAARHRTLAAAANAGR